MPAWWLIGRVVQAMAEILPIERETSNNQYISVNQESDVAHGPLVYIFAHVKIKNSCLTREINMIMRYDCIFGVLYIVAQHNNHFSKYSFESSLYTNNLIDNWNLLNNLFIIYFEHFATVSRQKPIESLFEIYILNTPETVSMGVKITCRQIDK